MTCEALGQSRYAPPKTRVKLVCENFFRRMAYDVWRRELKRMTFRSVADIGCGPGFLLGHIREWFPHANLIGVDHSAELLSIASEKCPGLVTRLADAATLPIEDQNIDVAFALHVVEHLADPEKFFSEVSRVLRKGGRVIIATPNPRGIGAMLAGTRWIGFKDPTHIQLQPPSFWRETLVKAGFAIERQGTTGLTGVPVIGRFPFSLLHWIPTFFFGFYPWERGEAYICIAKKL